MLITFAVTVFSVLWLFESHAAAVKRYNAFCVKRTANSDTEQNNISKSTFPVCVQINIPVCVSENLMWKVHNLYGKICNVRRQNSCDKFYKVV